MGIVGRLGQPQGKFGRPAVLTGGLKAPKAGKLAAPACTSSTSCRDGKALCPSVVRNVMLCLK